MNQEFGQAAASHSVRAVMRYLGTRLTGLSAEEVETQRSKFGVNTVTREMKKSIARRLVGAFVNPFTMILCVLALVSTATDMIFPAFELFGSVQDDFDPRSSASCDRFSRDYLLCLRAEGSFPRNRRA